MGEPCTSVDLWSVNACKVSRTAGKSTGRTGGPSATRNRYQMLGNSVAIPCVAYIMQGIVRRMETR